MKLLTKYIILLSVLLIINGCDKPAPTELVREEDPLQVEVLAKDTDDEIYSHEYDSTGVIYDPSKVSRGFANIVTVTGMKTSYRNSTVLTSFAQAIFFDKNFPVFSGDRLIGFKTRLLGDVDFNTRRANHLPLRVRFKRGSGAFSDTLLGFRHVLHHTPWNEGEDFNYKFHSSVNFNFDPDVGNTANFNIPTPSELMGSVYMEGTGSGLKGHINWNAGDGENFEIIIGVSKRNDRNVFPLFRLKTKDDGRLEIPSDLLNQIPFDRFGKIIFSLVRKVEFNYGNDVSTLYILSQSIHNLVVDIP